MSEQDLSETDKLPTQEELINLLKQIKKMIRNKEFSDFEMFTIKKDCTNIINHESVEIDPEAVRCIVTGWWVRDSIRQHGIDPDKPPPKT